MINIQNISISTIDFQLSQISFEIPKGECHAIMGPSGSGKTTLIEAICGLRKITSGTITIDNKNVTNLRPPERNIALVPQDNALFPHLTVYQHLTFGPTIQKWTKSEINSRTEQLAENLSISHLLNRKPTNLSGGEAKRVALARALATRPSLLCLDEALTGLDDQTHTETLQHLKTVITAEKTTTLHITHNKKEALELTSHIIHIPAPKHSPSPPNNG